MNPSTKKPSRAVEVWVESVNRRGDSTARQVARIRPGEARLIVKHGYGRARGRSGRAITLLIPVVALNKFIADMRFIEKYPMTSMDSRTFVKLPRLQGYDHAHNEAYGRHAEEREQLWGGDYAQALMDEEQAKIEAVKKRILTKSVIACRMAVTIDSTDQPDRS